jgi:NAD(P)-dependent dehydrogenase (short-subunit alcohol dehydrogenase family)
VADVADEAQTQPATEHAVRRFGGFDTWVNNAGTSIYGRSAEVPVAGKRKASETNSGRRAWVTGGTKTFEAGRRSAH